VITLHTMSTAAVHLPMGMYVFYEHDENGTRGAGTPWFIVDGTGPSFTLAAGAVREDRLPLRFYLRERPGRNGVRYLVYEDGPLGRLLPASQRLSATFVVTP
jgi:hypothetical protein